jgi:hypothetical protein
MLRDTTIKSLFLLAQVTRRRIIGITGGTIVTFAAAPIHAVLSMLGRFECVTDPIAVRDPLS